MNNNQHKDCNGEIIYLGIQEDDKFLHSCVECHQEFIFEKILQEDITSETVVNIKE